MADIQLSMAQQTVRMCSMCAGAFKYNPEEQNATPDKHSDVGKDCPTIYRE